MRSFLTWRTVVWVTLLSLIGFCIWQGAQLWRLNTEISNTTRSIQPDIDQQLKSLLHQVNVKKNRLASLDEQALSSQNPKSGDSGYDLISWMTEQAEVANTQMIGVEHLKERQVEQYIYAPVEFTLRGDYHSFGRLMNLLERSQYPLKLDSLSIASRDSADYDYLMDIVLCSLRSPTTSSPLDNSLTQSPLPKGGRGVVGQVSTIGGTTTKVQKKGNDSTVSALPKSGLALEMFLRDSSQAQNRTSLGDKLREGGQRFNPIGADFVYPGSDEMRDVFQRHHPEVAPQKENASPPPSLILKGVIYNERNPIAILMDEQKKSYLARINDTILDYTVLSIEQRSAILKRGDTQIELKVFKGKEIATTF